MLREYIQLTKPGIVRANVMTGAAAFLFASKGSIDLGLLAATLLGISLVISCGCVLNNIKDRNIDKKMKRTANRALVTKKISLSSAKKYAVVLGVLGMVTLIVFTNLITTVLGVLALFLYVKIYGFAKRHTHYGTEVGTLPGAASIIAGYTAVSGQLDAAALCLGLVMIAWQFPHFFSISIFRKDEYAEAGIALLPHRKGVPFTQRRIMKGILLLLIAIILLTIIGSMSLLFLLIVGGASGFWLYRALSGYQMISPIKWARSMFSYSLIILLIFSVTLAVDHWLP
jgi:protoheme IX farnesyltransferase